MSKNVTNAAEQFHLLSARRRPSPALHKHGHPYGLEEEPYKSNETIGAYLHQTDSKDIAHGWQLPAGHHAVPSLTHRCI